MPVFNTISETKLTPKALTLLHFTSLEEDAIHKHSVTIVQTILNITTSYNKIRKRKAGGLYRKHANEVTEKILLVATVKNAAGDN